MASLPVVPTERDVALGFATPGKKAVALCLSITLKKLWLIEGMTFYMPVPMTDVWPTAFKILSRRPGLGTIQSQ